MADDQLSALPPKKKAKTGEETSIPSEEHKTTAASTSSSCFGCKAEPGVTKCRYGCLSVDMCRSNDGGASSNDMKWCTSCIDSGNGLCVRYARSINVPSVRRRTRG
jgi:hypothetical protein